MGQITSLWTNALTNALKYHQHRSKHTIHPAGSSSEDTGAVGDKTPMTQAAVSKSYGVGKEAVKGEGTDP